MALGAGGLWLLIRAFPGALGSGQDKVWVAYYALWAVLMSLRLLSGGPVRWAEKAKYAAVWGVVIAVLAVGYSYRRELHAVVQRVQGEASGGYPVAVGPREMVITAHADGGFYVMGAVNGQAVRFLVDTGASDTVLSPDDARRIGLDPATLTFDRTAETANGMGRGAAVVVDSLSVGRIRMSDVPVIVNAAPMSTSLLGMTFLHRLESFQASGGRLHLKSYE
jgi:aspartyl protease family protein